MDFLFKDLTLNPKDFDLSAKYDEITFENMVNTIASDLSLFDNSRLAGRLLIYNVCRICSELDDYSYVMAHLLNDPVKKFFKDNFSVLQEAIIKNEYLNYRDYDFFSSSVIVDTYLMKPSYGEDSWETPVLQNLRIATQFYYEQGVERVLKCFNELCENYYTPASPTIFNAGTKTPQMSSCFLLDIEDTLQSILYTGVGDACTISSLSGGLGIGLSRLRHSQIGYSGMSSGILPVARIYDKGIDYSNQRGKRKGAGTLFLAIWHIDIWDFISSTDNFISHELRLTAINTCVWMNNLFFKRVANNEKWTVFCPAKTPKLLTTHGPEFEAAYLEYEKLAEEKETEYLALKAELIKSKKELSDNPTKKELKTHYRNVLIEEIKSRKERIEHKVYKASEMYDHIIDIQVKSGNPYIMNSDPSNYKSNQKNLGVIQSSNLCVAPETPILTSNGYFAIESLVDKEVMIWNGEQWSKVTVKRTSEDSELLNVLLDNGLFLTCTPQHKFLVDNSSNRSYVRVEAVKLKKNDKMLSFSTPVIEGSSQNDVLEPFQFTFDEIPLNASLINRINWFSKLINKKANLVINQQTFTLNLTENHQFLYKVQLLLQTMGVTTAISVVEDQFFNYSKSQLPEHYTKFTWVLTLSAFQIKRFLDLGCDFSRFDFSTKTFPLSDHPNDVKVVGVFNNSRRDKTYCFTESLKNAGVFNGILTGQCLEILEVSHNKIASCNLASHNLTKHAVDKFNFNTLDVNKELQRVYNFQNLALMSRSVVDNINKVIDHNYYPFDIHDKNGVTRGKISELNFETRPLGIGTSGFDDAVKTIDLIFDSPITELFNKMIFACLYFNSMCESLRLAVLHGEYGVFRTGTYKQFQKVENKQVIWKECQGCPLANGQFQFDLWKENAEMLSQLGELDTTIYNREDDNPLDPLSWGQEPFSFTDKQGNIITVQPSWQSLRELIMQYGVRNSLLIAPMPTATTSSKFSNAESNEVYTSNIFSRTVLSGSYTIVNRHLVRDLIEIGVWKKEYIDFLSACKGSVKYLLRFVDDHPNLYPDLFEEASQGENGKVFTMKAEIRERLRYLEQKYKTMFETSQKVILKYARQRGVYVCQSQSMNAYIPDPTSNKMKAYHSMAQKLGLKTGMYYLRQNPSKDIGSFNIPIDTLKYLEKIEKRDTTKTTLIPNIPVIQNTCTREMKESGCLSCS